MFPVTAVQGAVDNYATQRAISYATAENSQRQNAQDNRTPQQRMDEYRRDVIVPARERLAAQRQRVLGSEASFIGSVIEPNVQDSLLASGSYSYFVEQNGKYVQQELNFPARPAGYYFDNNGDFKQDLFDADVKAVRQLLGDRRAESSDIISSSDLPKKVRLVPVAQRVGSNTADRNDIVEFDISPDMSEDRQVNYLAISEIRAPGSLHLYMGTQGRTFTINAKLVTTNDEQAVANYNKMVALRAMTLPEKGYVGVLGDEGPPIPVRLYGYGMRLHGIPCVVTSLSIPYPEDVDYYYCEINGVQTGIPIVNTISVTLQEIRSADELLEQFDIQKFRTGNLPGW